jgi:hypothetical protein
MTRKQFGKLCCALAHGIAIMCAVCGLGVIVIAPLSFVVYGLVLFGAAIALDVILGAQCREVSKPRSHGKSRRAYN